jgi:cyclopropane fatty-acyl-phospholipid synthase-like methyltransferase
MPKRIETGTPEGDALGFTADLFTGWLELYEDARLYLHYLISRYRNEGNTQRLIRRWLRDGFNVRVVMPSSIMQHILRKFGFIPAYESLPNHYEDKVEVWRQPFALLHIRYISRPASRAGFS